jgi:hypothetical protein
MPRGCYQQLSSCGMQAFVELHLNSASQGSAEVSCDGCLHNTLFCKRVDQDHGHPVQV